MDLSCDFGAHAPDASVDAPAACFMAGSRQGVMLRDYLVANYGHLQRRLQRHLGCADQARDSLHDAWLRLGDTEIPAAVQSPEAYVFRMACNLATDQWRHHRPWQHAGDTDSELAYLVDEAPGPDFIAEARSDLAAVDRAIRRMPRRHRAVLMALRVEEMTREQVATRYELSLRGVDTALQQALQYCAENTGHQVLAGVSAPRRRLSARQIRA